MKGKKLEQKKVNKTQPFVVNDQVKRSNSAEMSKKENLEINPIEIFSDNKCKMESETKKVTPKSERPFRSRLPKLKMFIPRRPKSSSRNRNEDKKAITKQNQHPRYSPKPSPRDNRKMASNTKSKQSLKSTPQKFESTELQKSRIRSSPRCSPKLATRSPIKRGACAASPLIDRKKNKNLKNSPIIQRNTIRPEEIIATALSPSSNKSTPTASMKDEKDRVNEQEKLRIINEILIANLPGSDKNGLSVNDVPKGSLSSRPSKIPVYQNQYQKEVRLKNGIHRKYR